MDQNFLSQLKRLRIQEGYSINTFSKKTKISKKIIKEIETLRDTEVDLFPQKHLLFLYIKHLGLQIPKQYISKVSHIKKELTNSSDNINQSNSIDSFKYQIILKFIVPLFLIAIIIILNSESKNNDFLSGLVSVDTDIASHNNFESYENNNLIVNGSKSENELFFSSKDKLQNSVSLSGDIAKQSSKEIINLTLTFDNEVWLKIENSDEVILSKIFTKDDFLAIDVLDGDEIFVTSGNMGLILIKVNNSEPKFLGSLGEIGRKKIF